MVDLYYALYGTRRPICLQSADISNLYKDIIKEGTKKTTVPNSSTISNNELKTTTIISEVKNELVDIVEEHTSITLVKRTATEAFEVGNEIIKLETTEEVTLVEDNDMKVESFENEVKVVVNQKDDGHVHSPEPKRMKSEIFEEDDNSVTIIDVGENTIMKADSSFEANKTDAESRHKTEVSSKVCAELISHIQNI